MCLDTKPPFYEGVAVNGYFIDSDQPMQCCWQQKGEARLTLQAVVERFGFCLGIVADTYRPPCNRIVQAPPHRFLLPPKNGWWTCSSGLAPCVCEQVLSQHKDFYVLVYLVPKIIYHTDRNFPVTAGTRLKRDPVTALTLGILLSLRLAGARDWDRSLAV